MLIKWINEYTKNIKDPLYATIMNVLTEINPNSLMEVYKNMGVAQISEENREFLLKAMKKLQLDKTLKEEGENEKAIKIAKNLIRMGLNVEQVAKAAEITIDQVEKIKKQIQIS